MIKDFNKLFHKTSLLSDVDAFPIVVDLFIDMLKNEMDAKGEQMLEAMLENEFSKTQWSDLLKTVALVRQRDDVNISCKPSSEYSEYPSTSLVFEKLCSYCEKRQKRLNYIALTVMPNAMQYVPKLTNIDINSLPSVLKNYAVKHEITDDEIKFPDVKVAKEALYYLGAMRECVIQRNMSAAYTDETVMADLDELEALYGVLLNYYESLSRRTHQISHSFYAFPHFVYCAKCWRLIPESYAKRHTQRCDEHNPNSAPSTVTRKIKVIHEDITASNPVFSRDAEKKLAELNMAWKPSYGGISHNEWLIALETLESSHLPTVAYDLAKIWDTCPHTQKYLLKNGVNSMDVAAVLAVLAPTLADATPEEQQQCQALHSILIKNFWLFRIDLSMAETWLSKYHQHYGNRTHGGVRPNTGGKRVGAGRPPKSQ